LIELVLDASVVLKWFGPAREKFVKEARAIRTRYRAGEAAITVPSLLYLELLNVAGRRWGWSEDALAQLASTLESLDFDVSEADLPSVAAWIARGLSAYDAAYLALAESRGLPLITDDELILRLAPEVARPLSQAL